jgi:hypothetical protein
MAVQAATQQEIWQFVDDFAAFVEAEQREEAYQFWYAVAATVDEVLEAKLLHIRDSQGRLLTHFDQWLAAAYAGEWPADG